MADQKISQFANGGTVQPADEIATNRAGVNTKVFVGTAAGADIGIGPNDVPNNSMVPSTIANTLQGTSLTSNTIGLGSKSFVTEPAKSFETGRSLLITSDGSPTTRRMTGIVTDYDTATGELDIDIQGITGSGTYSDWTIRVSGDKGEEGPQGPQGPAGTGAVSSVNGQTGAVTLNGADIPNSPAGGISATTTQAAINELDTEKAPKTGASLTSSSINGVTPTTAGSATQFLNGQGNYVSVPSTFNNAYTSSNQTITTGGLLTLAHGLGSKPQLTKVYLYNAVAEAGWSVGDEPEIVTGAESAGGRINMVWSDATNVYVRFANTASCFSIGTKSTGAPAALTNANWRLIVRAWK